MANPEHVELVQQGAKAIAVWRKTNPKKPLDLRGANLSSANPRFADLTGAMIKRNTKFDDVFVNSETKGLGPWLFNPDIYIVREIEFPPEYKPAAVSMTRRFMQQRLLQSQFRESPQIRRLSCPF